jgi:hypothetical protein
MIRRALVLLLFVTLGPLSLGAQEERSSVRIVPFESEGSTDVGRQLADTVEQTIRLSLRLLPEIRVVGSGEDVQESVEISGTVSTGDGEYEILLTLRDRRIPGEAQELSVSTGSVLEIFDLADRLTEEAVRQISRRDIAFGSLTLTPTGEGSWQVRLGGERFPGSPRSFNRLPAGTYDIALLQLQGDELVTLLEEQVTIESGLTTRLDFDLPDPAIVARRLISRSESEYIQTVLYGTASPLSAILDRAEAAAQQAAIGELYAPRISAWRPGSNLETGATTGLLLPAQGARARLSSYLERSLAPNPTPTEAVAEAMDAFDEQLEAWMTEREGF